MAENNFIPINIPKPFNPDKNNVSKDWRIWKNEFSIYLELISSSVKFTEKGKAYRLLNCIGTKGIEAMNEMTFENSDERENMDILLKKFDEIFDPPFDEIEERYKFFSRRKHPKESLDNYLADMTEKVSKCNFGDQKEKFLIDMIILNMDKDYQHAAFALDDVSLPSIIQIYNQQLIYNQKMKELMDHEESLNKNSENISGAENINHVKSVFKDVDKEKLGSNVQNLTSDKYEYMYTKNNNLKQQVGKSNDTAGKFSKDPPLRGSMEPGPTKSPSKAGPLCSKCLTNHVVFMRCPAYNATCSYCFENGHYTTACTLKNATEETANLPKHASNKKNESLAKCSWCETRHAANQCPHDKDCTLCEIFPHNVCFNCRSNPHTHTCYYKGYVKLPTPQGYPTSSTKDHEYTDVATTTARNSEQTRERGCSRCGCLHPPRKCLAYNKRCSSCDKLGHFEWKCKSRPTNRALEDCPICHTKRLQHLNKNRYFCNRCAKFYFINGSDEDDDDEQEEDKSCTIS
ncbi:uncharacterized protein LOC100678320 [Nasonia vitripennis]|uniref:CCHC-type domain-containing protein n=1 Tax=Nasonia vitripennis TaxID=7425 RepID=A0A7M7IR08_NASVI|nr:uncharacterized protein LOC100678320 [Nasonia vitripennis]XP_008211468.1 uncharacterized protein LOC100678320 [Nasonia vitripennis]XP_008211469.1 uncharacterized protein LOC100678320 [Nasonia vitripennis]XP_016840582.1 uncharacterized protein LOC100678320 [Nasonia vitripennis]